MCGIIRSTQLRFITSTIRTTKVWKARDLSLSLSLSSLSAYVSLLSGCWHHTIYLVPFQTNLITQIQKLNKAVTSQVISALTGCHGIAGWVKNFVVITNDLLFFSFHSQLCVFAYFDSLFSIVQTSAGYQGP